MLQNNLKLLLIEYAVKWESSTENLFFLEREISEYLEDNELPDIIILPEFFSTGFTMNPDCSEDMMGDSVRWLREKSQKYNCAFVASVPVVSAVAFNGVYKRVNRAFFVTPVSGEYYYDKRHIFRMGGEDVVYTPGDRRIIVEYKGWKIMLNTCYDLRFPVWSRNIGGDEYDLLINIANWPDSRIHITDHLIRSRAIENSCYFAFVNRLGKDIDISYNGGSNVINYKGSDIVDKKTEKNNISFYEAECNMKQLLEFRSKFPVWRDADNFRILP